MRNGDLVLAGNPDNRFLPFAVEEGGRIGTDAEAYIDAIVRAGSADPATWCATKTYCMRALAISVLRISSNLRSRALRSIGCCRGDYVPTVAAANRVEVEVVVEGKGCNDLRS